MPHPDHHRALRVPVAAGLAFVLAVFAALAEELAEWQPFVSLDRHIDEELHERATPWVTDAMEFVSWLGNSRTLTAVTAVAVVAFVVTGRMRPAILVGAAFVGVELLATALKVEFARPRPSFADPVVAQSGGYSFPSGHAAASAAVYGALAYLVGTSRRERRARVACAAGAMVLVVAIGFSRVYLGKHFPSDVIGGWCVGAAWVALLVLLLFTAAPRRVRAEAPG